MTAWDNSGMERLPFDGRVTPLPTRRRRRQVPVAGNHGPDCSSNPEIGCVCDYDPGEHAPPDELVGVQEIAQRAGVSQPAVSGWIVRHPDFPAPVARLACGTIFAWIDVQEWLTATGRLGR